MRTIRRNPPKQARRPGMSEDKYKEMKPEKEKELISNINIIRGLLPPSPFDFIFDRPKPVKGDFELVTNFNKSNYWIYEL